MSARKITSLTYGMLVEHADTDGRADIDAALSSLPATKDVDAMLVLAIGGEIGP